MPDLRQQTIDVYNATAEAMADKFRKIGPRVKDIDLAFRLSGAGKDANVLEIGCGDGRDAKEIVNRTSRYLGIDVSKELIRLARDYVPEGNFKIADAASFVYPKGLNVVFAFASLLHLDISEIEHVLSQVHDSLEVGGVFYISLKWATEYKQEVKRDEFGERLFYLYTPELIIELAGNGYAVDLAERQTREGANHPEWFELVLRKI